MKTLNQLHSRACSFTLQLWHRGAADVVLVCCAATRCGHACGSGCSSWTRRGSIHTGLTQRDFDWNLDIFIELHQMTWPLLNSPMHRHARALGNGPKFAYGMFTKQLLPWKEESKWWNEISYEKWIYSIYIALCSSLKWWTVYHSYLINRTESKVWDFVSILHSPFNTRYFLTCMISV